MASQFTVPSSIIAYQRRPRGPSAVCREVCMPENVGADQLVILRIEGMHCHKCEQAIQKALTQHDGVHEVEVVFGVPVLALHRWGAALGPSDWQRWVSLLEALLCGWIVYVNLGMLFEGLMLLLHRRRLTPDLLVSAIATALYLVSLASALHAI